MKNLVKDVNKKVNGIIFSLLGTGAILIMLAIVIAANEFVFRLLTGILISVVAYMFLYGAYKLYSIKKEVKKYLKF